MFLDFIINNTLSFFSILAIIAFIIVSIFLIIEIKKLKNLLNNNGVQKNNISEILNVQRKKEKYTENEIEALIVDIMMELKKTNKKLNNWKGFGIFIIIFIIWIILRNIFPQ